MDNIVQTKGDVELPQGHFALRPPVPLVTRKGSRVVDVNAIPWTDMPLPGNRFKLLNIDEVNGGVTMLVQADADAPAWVHKHIGAVEIYNVSGWWKYEDMDLPIGPDHYVYEPNSVVHEPVFHEQVVQLVIMHGTIVGYDEQGRVSGTLDADVLYELAMANGAAAHLPTRE